MTSSTHRVVARAIREQAIERLLAVAVDVDLVAIGFEVEAQPVGEVRFVFDDQDPAHPSTPSTRVLAVLRTRRARSATGSLTPSAVRA